MWLFLALAEALAATPTSGPPSGSSLDATEHEEYTRLSEELGRLAMRNAWAGVERTFIELVETGVPLSWDDWWRGAQAARANGDIAAARERLRSANAIREDRAIIDTLWQIDNKFGTVALWCDPGSYVTLVGESASLVDPDALRALEHAKDAIHETCAFSGLLPVGSYRLYDRLVEVAAHQAPVEVDLRDLAIDRRARKGLRATWLANRPVSGGDEP